MTQSFLIDPNWSALFKARDTRTADVLRRANLPEDLFTRARPTLPTEPFLRLWDALIEVLDTPAPGLVLAQAMSLEHFSPPLFAAFCSPNL
ncbi:unnamed protein product, partial [Ectocarpus sp. 12 AP-2014]